jgi:DNA polymerase
MLETIKDEKGKYDRSNYYITNIMPWRPPANRKPTVEETLLMLPFVLEHISIISPSLILLIGSVAFQAILGHLKLSITQAQGNCFELNIGGVMRKIFVVYHPSYALRVSSKKRDLWLSLLKMDEVYKSLQ